MRGEPTPIHEWEFLSNSTYPKPEKIAYCGENILHFQKDVFANPKKYIAKSYPTQTLLTHRCLSNYKTETIILKYLVAHHQFNHNQLSEKEEKHWRFWKYLDLAKLPRIHCLPPKGSIFLQRFLELSPEGVYGGSYENPQKIDFYNHFRLDYLFFEGPEIAQIHLEDRKALRLAILKALDPVAGFSIKDAFVLFDYEKIPTQKWDFNDGYNSENISLFPDYFLSVSSREDSEDVVFIDYSIEAIWAKRPDFLGSDFAHASDFIEKTLTNAIIKD